MSILKKYLSIVLSLGVLLLVLSGCASADEKASATSEFTMETDRISKEIRTLEGVIADSETLIKSEKVPYDEKTQTTLESATSKARASIDELPEIPTKLEDIKDTTEELKKISYVETTEDLQSAYNDYEESIAIMDQITNPSEAFVIGVLEQIEGITGYAAATEDNDPNGQLHKAGGYTSAVYFEYDKVDQSNVYGADIIEKGTDAGGQIEVYETAEDAEKRNDYLGAFDGSAFSSGSHTVLGTIVIRTSDELNATQQKELEEAIIKVFTTLAE